MIARLFWIELLKIRRSMMFIITLACPFAVVALVFAMGLHRTLPDEVDGERVSLLWSGASIMWSAFMLPLYIALVTSVINGNEHRNHTWRVMFSLPIGVFELYLAKALVAAVLVLGAHLTLFLFTLSGVSAIHLVGYDNSIVLNGQAIRLLWAAPLAALPILMIQHGLSWFCTSVVPPFATAIVGTFTALQVGKSEYWLYLPWAYPLVSSTSSAGNSVVVATTLAPALALALLLLAFSIFRRPEGGLRSPR